MIKEFIFRELSESMGGLCSWNSREFYSRRFTRRARRDKDHKEEKATHRHK
jgi:hypothetical protein